MNPGSPDLAVRADTGVARTAEASSRGTPRALTAFAGFIDAASYLGLDRVFVANMTVLTLTLTRLAAESRIAGGHGSGTGRRVTAITAMLVGALVGAVLVLGVGLTPTLFAGAALLAAVTVVSGVRHGAGE